MYQRILVPLDGSDLAESVLPMVRRLALASGGTVMLLHVLERGAPTTVHGQSHLTSASAADTYLSNVAERLSADGIDVETHAHDNPEGNVARSIIDHADESGADLVVLCTHGRGGMRRFLFGSIAQMVIQGGTRPVLLVRPTPGGTAPAEAGKVLVALDGTAGAESTLEPASQLAMSLHTSLHLVLVVPTRWTVRGDRVPASIMLPSATRSALDIEHEEAMGYLRHVAEDMEQAGVRVTAEVRRGDIIATLVEAARRPDIELIAVATHGRFGLQAPWMGSIAGELASQTGMPVLLLHRENDSGGDEHSSP